MIESRSTPSPVRRSENYSFKEAFRFYLCLMLSGAMLGLPLRSLGCERTEEHTIEAIFGYCVDRCLFEDHELWYITTTIRNEGTTSETTTSEQTGYDYWQLEDCNSALCAPEDDDEDGGSCEDDGSGFWDGANPFSVYDGNVTRKVDDLTVPGASGGLLHWMRHHNTVPRLSGATPFGSAGCWRHNFQYDLIESTLEGGPRQLALIYPDGTRRIFVPAAGGSGWAAQPQFDEKISATSVGYDITTPQGEILHFVHRPGAETADARRVLTGGEGNYEMRQRTDASGLVTTFDYNQSGSLTRVTEPAGRSFTVSYRDVAFKRGNVRELANNFAVPAPGQWTEIPVPEALRSTKFCEVRVVTTYNRTLSSAEIQLGSGPAIALQCVDRQGQLILGTPQSLGATVRVRVPAGQEAELTGALLVATELEDFTRPVISRVEGSNGQGIDYDYDVVTSPSGREHVGLTGVHYGDNIQAKYRYDWASNKLHPMLVECDDPRNPDKAKRIRYRFQPGTVGRIHQEINPATGGVYATLEFDKNDPDKRVVRYADDRTIVYRTPQSTGGRVTEKTDGMGRKTRYEYADNGKGRLSAKVHHDGTRHEIERDAAGRIAARYCVSPATQERRLEKRYERDGKGRPTKVTDRHARTKNYERAASGRITKIDDAKRKLREFTYDEIGRVTSFKRADGALYRVAYNEQGLRSEIVDPQGLTTRYGYNAHGERVSVTDPLGRVTRREVDARGKTIKSIAPDGTIRKYAYDAYGRKIAETDAQGRTTRLAYDELSRVIRSEDARGGVTTFDYTELPNGCGSCTLVPQPSRIVHPDGRVTQNLYDAAGRLLSRTENAGTPEQATTTYTYDDDNNLVAISDPLGRATRYTYDDEHHRLSATDPLGRTTLWSYDEDGNVASVTTPDGATSTSEYNRNNRLVKTTDAEGNITRYAYDVLGNLTQIVDALGQKTRHEYDGARRTATIYADGTRQTWEYDAVGHVLKTTNPDGAVIAMTYDSGGRVLTQKINDARGALLASAANSYDTLGHRVSTTDALGRTIHWTYDARGNMNATIRPDGAQTTNAYDAKDCVTSTTDALGQTNRYSYTESGDLASLTDANGNTHRFAYDSARRKTAMVYPDGSTEIWIYNAGGQLTVYTNRSGQTKTIAYNLAGQPVSETWANPATPSPLAPRLAPNVSYIYNAAGHLISIDNGAAKLGFTYNKRGRLASESSDLSALLSSLTPQTVGYRYDDLGRKAGLVYPDGGKVRYGYDARNRLTTIDDGGRGKSLVAYEYDPLGRIAQLTRDNSVATRYEYDMAGQLTDITHTNGGETLASSRYELDVLGRRTAQTREDNIAERYMYDATSQLTGVDYGTGKTEAFAYDPVGNRTQASEIANAKSQITKYAANNLNQYTRIDYSLPATRSLLLAYDANGNLINDGQYLYGYDSQNRLISVTSSMSSVSATSPMSSAPIRADFAYDARNRCVLRRYYTQNVQGQWTLNTADSRALTYDTAWNLLAERTLDGRQAAEYIHGQRTDEILASEITNPSNQKLERAYPLTDGLGSTVALASKQGRVTQRYRYTAYGHPSALTSDFRPLVSGSTYRFLFTGREWLTDIQLNDHRNRYYSPSLGRFINTDPIRFLGGDNLYAYVSNNAADLVDPMGTACKRTWKNRFSDCMATMGVPTPDNVWTTVTAAGAEVVTWATAANTYGAATLTEIGGGIAAAGAEGGVAAVIVEAAPVAAALTAAAYAGIVAGCSLTATFHLN